MRNLRNLRVIRSLFGKENDFVYIYKKTGDVNFHTIIYKTFLFRLDIVSCRRVMDV